MKTLGKFVCLITAMATVTAAAQTFEAMPSYVVSPAPGFTPVYSTIVGTVGWTFQPTTDISVTALGAFAGLASIFEVGLWDSSGTLLASSTINGGSTPVNLSLYSAITPVALTEGDTYYIGAFDPAGQFQEVVLGNAIGDGYPVMDPDIQLGSVTSANTGAFQFPGNTEGVPGTAIIGANFEFQAVPEPATLALGGFGTLVLMAMRRRR